jgi:hypothetical protein
MTMTRKEKVGIKTKIFTNKILDAMKLGEVSWKESCENGDRFISTCIKTNPNEKSFYINCGQRLVNQLLILMEQNKSKENQNACIRQSNATGDRTCQTHADEPVIHQVPL